MKGNKEELLRGLQSRLINLSTDTESLKKFYTIGCNRYNWNIQDMSNFITMNKSLDEASDFEIYMLASIYGIVFEIDNYIFTLFDNDEIGYFRLMKADGKTILPFKIKAFEINEGKEYVCCLDSNTLLNLYQNNLLRRLLRNKKINKDDIAITDLKVPTSAYVRNKKYINMIQDDTTSAGEIVLEAYNTNRYNIKMFYNKETEELSIDDILFFDIIDGKKRIEMMLYLLNSERKNYKISVRILNYSKNATLELIAYNTRNLSLISELHMK